MIASQTELGPDPVDPGFLKLNIILVRWGWGWGGGGWKRLQLPLLPQTFSDAYPFTLLKRA
ncbi:hypothetical protein JZ751_012549 [Albula glossodonta]|uniref:Uncharacterized protein n=1 Tax=Albula glossodonta TaxID=121402 RepID=A0A8T2NV58_9TELE|nr:hypothetical protein JZ751_012549 [Albula glossodonta]